MPNDVAASGDRSARLIPPTRSQRLGRTARLLLSASLVAPLALSGCGSVRQVRNLVVGRPSPYLAGYIGNVAADEPVAALTGRDVLARGGNAADAAAATGLALAVTLPSRASLGGGGACLAWRPGAKSVPEAFLFTPVAGTTSPGPDARPAAVPMLARGLFLLQARYGSVSFDDLVKPAARLARSGITISRALADDLAAVSGPLLRDPGAAAIFSHDGVPYAAGDQLVQPDLAGTLDRLAVAGVGDLYTGLLWQNFTAGAAAAGGGLSLADIHDALPAQSAPILLQDGNRSVAFLPPPADGGLGAAAAFQAGGEAGVADRIVGAWRAAHPDTRNDGDYAAEAQSLLGGGLGAGGGALRRLPASTSFTVLDRHGGAVACALTMDNLFGTGRVAGATGIVLAASPARLPRPLLAAAIAWTPGSGSFHAAVAGSGQNQAAGAVGAAMLAAIHDQPVAAVTSPATDAGRVNAIVCGRGLPGDAASCHAGTDPRGDGLATRSD